MSNRKSNKPKQLTLTEAYIIGYGCWCCSHWKHSVVDLGTCRRDGPCPTLAGEICEHLKLNEEKLK